MQAYMGALTLGLGGGLILGAVGLGLLLVVVLVLASIYNSLIRKSVDCDNGWSQIDVQLKRRYDLIPNLVETVKGYANHERQTLEAVVAARNQAVQVSTAGAPVADRIQAEGALTQALGRLFAVAEAYPDLKANTGFNQLQEELASTENKIGFARQHYNDCVGRYETSRQVFPSNLVAGLFGFKSKASDYFKTESAVEREAPKVKFS